MIIKDVYDYTTPQVVAMWKAYCAAPNNTTVAELRELMDAAAAAVEQTAANYLADRADPRVQTALTRKCTICGAKPDNDCTWNGKPLNRIVHQCRAEAHMDRRGARDE